jgi:hypothetical protein
MLSAKDCHGLGPSLEHPARGVHSGSLKCGAKPGDSCLLARHSHGDGYVWRSGLAEERMISYPGLNRLVSDRRGIVDGVEVGDTSPENRNGR